MVAAAGQKTAMKPLYAVACLVGIIAGLLAFTYLNGKQSLVLNSSLHHPPEVMASKARAVITQLGYSDQSADSAYGYDADQVCSDYYDKLSKSPDRWQPVREGKTPAVHFWYRQSPRDLVPNKERIFTGSNFPLVVTASDPPENVSGMIGVKLNPRGQLIRFGVVPPQIIEANAKTSEPDWKQAFDLAGLDFARFTPTTAQWMPNPPGACDLQMAWTGVYGDQPELPIRVEAAAYRGKLVSFQIIAPYTQASRSTPWTTAEKSSQAFKTVVFFAILLGAIFFTRHNLRQGRGDRKGALRLTAFTFVTMLLGAVLGSAWDPINLIRTFVAHTGNALYQSIWIGLLYLALEPFLRRRWPPALITWSRVLQGKLRDAVVGRDALIGILWASLSYPVFLLPMVAEGKLTNDAWFIHNLLGVRYGFAWMLGQVGWAIFFAFACFLLFFLLMLLTRRQWIAGSITVLLSLVYAILDGAPLNIAVGLFYYSGLVLVLLRYGLWATAVSIFAGSIINVSCLTLQFSAWYAGGAILGFVVLLALAGFAFYTSLGGQKVFTGKLLEE
jgi:serine/threonine-protein kinase